MNGLRIDSNKQNRTIHKAYIDEPAMLALAVDHVARSLGLEASAENLRVRAYTSTYKEGSLGTSRTRIEVELIEDHEPEIGAPEAS